MNTGKKEKEVVIGQQITFEMDFDITAAGYGGRPLDMPYGYYINRCSVFNVASVEKKLAIIGSSVKGVNDRCFLESDFFKINININYDHYDQWTPTKFILAFDAFKVGVSSDLGLTCEVRMCVKDLTCPKEQPTCD